MKRFLLQMAGLPGSGKSTLARALRERTQAVLVDKDEIMVASMRAGVEPGQSGALAYEIGFELMRSLLAQGHSVILDSPANFQRIREMGRCIAEQACVAYMIIECGVPKLELLEERLSSRRPLHTLHPATLAGLDLDYSRPGAAPLSERHLSVDTSRPLEICLQDALEYIGYDEG